MVLGAKHASYRHVAGSGTVVHPEAVTPHFEALLRGFIWLPTNHSMANIFCPPDDGQSDAIVGVELNQKVLGVVHLGTGKVHLGDVHWVETILLQVGGNICDVVITQPV